MPLSGGFLFTTEGTEATENLMHKAFSVLSVCSVVQAELWDYPLSVVTRGKGVGSRKFMDFC